MFMTETQEERKQLFNI